VIKKKTELHNLKKEIEKENQNKTLEVIDGARMRLLLLCKIQQKNDDEQKKNLVFK